MSDKGLAMSERITIRLPKQTYQLLKNESAKAGIGASVLVRQWVENFFIRSSKTLPSVCSEKTFDSKTQDDLKTLYPLIQENNLLLRKIARYTNAQIVIETDEQLKNLRKKNGF